ncbi:Dsl1 protein [Saccharomycopsis crataegensis]|uniref:Dsl1 protein n=1 Tax=Saccharomycopsis crataegensis TaxID=43959 RepID=A0AAV5QP00_9ASCO|nr:Dsl1 protein [Saccharomycopsis crataegensis]
MVIATGLPGALAGQIDGEIASVNQQLESRLTILAENESSKHNLSVNYYTNPGNNNSNNGERELKLGLLDKIWVIKNLIKEVEFSYEQPFAFQFQSINYNVNKLDEKLGSLKNYINDVSYHQEVSKARTAPQLTPRNQILYPNGVENTVSLPGGFSDFSPEKLQNVSLTDQELISTDTTKDYSKNIIIIRLFENKINGFKTVYFQKLLELMDKFCQCHGAEDDSTVLVQVSHKLVNTYDDLIEESVTIEEFCEFLDENYHTLAMKNPSFKNDFDLKIHRFSTLVGENVGSKLLSVNQHQKKLELVKDDNSFKLVSTNDASVKKTFNAFITNMSQLLEFFILLPPFLRRSLLKPGKVDANSLFAKNELSGFINFNLLLLISGYNQCCIDQSNKRLLVTIKQDIITLIKLIYLLIKLKILNKNDFYFLNLDSNELNEKSTNELFIAYLNNLPTIELNDYNKNLWSGNINKLIDFHLDKKLNRIINEIKSYLTTFDTFDLIFHELIDRSEIDFREVKSVETPKLPPPPAPEPEVISKPSSPIKKSPRAHQRTFSGATNIMDSINENEQSIDSLLGSKIQEKTTEDSKRKNNRRTSVFALNAGRGSSNALFSQFQSPTISEDESPLELKIPQDRSFNQDALDSLIGKTSTPNLGPPTQPIIITQTVNGDRDPSHKSLQGPPSGITSPMSPVTPLSPFDFSSNSQRFSNIDKKRPDDDRKRFSKRFSSYQQHQQQGSGTDEDSGSIHSEGTADTSNAPSGTSLGRRASKRISKRLSKRFSTFSAEKPKDKAGSFDDSEDFDLDEDAWGGDDDLDLDLDLEMNDVNTTAHGIGLMKKDEKTVSKKRSSKSIVSFNSIDEELDDWGWGDDEEEEDLNLNESDILGGQDQKQGHNEADKETEDAVADFTVSSFKSTKIPDEIFGIIMNFVEYLTELSNKVNETQEISDFSITNEEIMNKINQLMDIFYLIGGYSKYDSKFLFYNDVYYLNILLKQKLINLKILFNPYTREELTKLSEPINPQVAFKGPVLFDEKIENYLTNIINLEKISFLRIYRKFQNFTNLSSPANGSNSSNMILTQLEFKFKEIFFAGGFQQLSINLKQLIVVNFLNEFYQLIINDILQISLISEHDSEELCKIISHMLRFVSFFGNLHAADDDTVEDYAQINEKDFAKETSEDVIFYKKNISNFSKLANFKIVVSSHLASIMENFYNGEFYNMETEELIHLIKSLFVESDIRRNAIKEIEEIRNISI